MNFDRWIEGWYSRRASLRGYILRLALDRAGSRFLVDRGCVIRTPSKLRVGDNVWLREGVVLDARSDREVGINIGNGVTIRAYSFLDAHEHEGCIDIGENAAIGQYVYIGGDGGVRIGRDAMISGHTYIVSANHVTDPSNAAPYQQQGDRRREVSIGDNAWVAARSVVLAGVTIGCGAVVAAGSVVVRDVPEYTLVAGVPAEIKKSLI